MQKIVVINGYPQVGKSTFVSMCYDVNKDVIELSMVDSVKKVATYAGWNGKKDEKGRKFLAAIKQAMMEYDEGPRKAIDRYILSHPGKVCFINARNPEDIQYFVDKYNAVTLYIALAPNVGVDKYGILMKKI